MSAFSKPKYSTASTRRIAGPNFQGATRNLRRENGSEIAGLPDGIFNRRSVCRLAAKAMFRLVACLLLTQCFALAAAAEEPPFVPRLYDVTGVAADDVLNIRAAPDASSDIVGALSPIAEGIEVTALNEMENWGRVANGESDGWVSLAFLAERPFPPGEIPTGMSCFGTEPFWSLDFEESGMRYRTPYVDWPYLEGRAAASPVPPGNRLFGFDTASPDGRLSGVIEAGACSDGMSDRAFGWRVTLLRQSEGALTLESGCCTLDMR